jgi:hypothetical protein
LIQQTHFPDTFAGTENGYDHVAAVFLRHVDFDGAADDEVNNLARLLNGHQCGVGGESLRVKRVPELL